ncbi:MAG: type II toxin-antitoxin system VapC family toxin, partial [Campylobacterales bacterium]|nr:type II toxin-antitoxin system VapC family toxin [Campylobacterales bacterium]
DLSLNTLYYIGSKTDRNTTFNFMKDITFNNPLFEVYYTKERDLKEIYGYMDKSTNADFEDLLQYAAAKNSGCSVIITNDKNFPKLDIPLIRTNPNIEDYFPNNSDTYISI